MKNNTQVIEHMEKIGFVTTARAMEITHHGGYGAATSLYVDKGVDHIALCPSNANAKKAYYMWRESDLARAMNQRPRTNGKNGVKAPATEDERHAQLIELFQGVSRQITGLHDRVKDLEDTAAAPATQA